MQWVDSHVKVCANCCLFPTKAAFKELSDLDSFKTPWSHCYEVDIEEILVEGFFDKFLDLAHDSLHKLARKRTRPIFPLCRFF